jgi:TrmH family RNA methyltransferase
VLEGERVLEEAQSAGVALESVFFLDSASVDAMSRARDAGVPAFALEPGVMERVADTVTPPSVLAIAPFVDVTIDALATATLVVVCVDVRDPGNLGTVLRSAEAAGAGGVVCCDGSVDLYNPKVVRASAGSIFYVPVVAGGEPVEVLERLGAAGLQRLGALAHGGDPVDDIDLRVPLALVLGNEAHGLPDEANARLDRHVTIPMAGRSESLNVGMAAAVLCFETARQRRAG